MNWLVHFLLFCGLGGIVGVFTGLGVLRFTFFQPSSISNLQIFCFQMKQTPVKGGSDRHRVALVFDLVYDVSWKSALNT